MYSSKFFASVVGLEHIVSSLQGKYFPLADEPSRDDLAALNVDDRVGDDLEAAAAHRWQRGQDF